MSINTSEVDKIVDFITRAGKESADEQIPGFLEKVASSVKTAKENMADNEEKYAVLLDSVTRWANQMVFTLFRENKLTAELEKEYRELRPVAETTAAVEALAKVRQDKIDALNDEHAKIVREQNGLDIFRAIISGMSAEKAKAKLQEYEDQIAQAQAQLQK